MKNLAGPVLPILLLGIVYCAGFSTPAFADECSDAYPGAEPTPSPNWESNPYPDACYIDFPGGGGATRDDYQGKCQDIPGYLEFKGDYGSNRNTCVFRPESSDPGEHQSPVDPDDSLDNECLGLLAQTGAIYKNEEEFSKSSWAKKESLGDYLRDLRAETAQIESKCIDSKYASQIRNQLDRIEKALENLSPEEPQVPDPVETPPETEKSRPWFTLEICNYYGDGKMWIALDVANHSASERTKVVSGWWSVDDGKCAAILQRDFGDWSSMEVYMHAHTKNYTWPSKAHTDTTKCIADRVYTRTETSPYSCKPDEISRPFFRYVVNKQNDQHTVDQMTFRKNR